MRKRPLLWFACVFFSGLAFERYKSIYLMLIPCSFIVVEIYYGVKRKTIYKAAGRSLILLSAFLLGIWHMEEGENFRVRYMQELESVTKTQQVILWGEVVDIKYTDYGVRMRLTDCYIRLKERNIPCNDVLVYAASTHYQVGEIQKIKGKLNLFESAKNEGGFDSKVFYQSQKIDFSVWLETSQKVGVKENIMRDYLLLLKEHLLKVLQNNMDEDAAGFFSGMLLGDKSNLEREVKDLFELGGISHILAISGLHVSMIGRKFYQMLRKVGVRFTGAGILAGILLLAYGFMVGNGMSAVRAIGMMFIFFLGQILGRSYDMLNALGTMLVLLLWDNPFLLEYSGFWFSVMALIGIGFVGRNMNMCLGVTLSTLPIIASCYYEIPLYSPLVNAVVLPLLTPIFLLLILGTLIGMFSLSGIMGGLFSLVSKVILLPCSWGFGFYIWLCKFVEKLPFASIICGKPENGVVIAYYMILVLIVLYLQRLHEIERNIKVQNEKVKIVWRRRGFAFGMSLICLGLIVYPKPKPFEITFQDVGQGDAIYIAAGDGTTYFIDGGSTSEEAVGEYIILPFLKAKGVAFVDYWFVSHADADHISGIFEVLESGYKVKTLVLSKYAPKDENMLHLVSVAEACNTQVLYLDAGDKIASDKIRFTCLYPWDTSIQDKNEASLVLELAYEDKKALFAGDISSKTEQLLLEKGVVDDIWLYKASHHGSKYSNSLELLEVLQPEISVVSCSMRNLYGHPHEEAISRMEEVGSELFFTMENGQVTVRLLQ